jgi:hypothetical protein
MKTKQMVCRNTNYMNKYFMTLGSAFHRYNAFSLEISFALEIRFSEQNWHKLNCKSVLVRPLFLYGLPHKYIPPEINKDW